MNRQELGQSFNDAENEGFDQYQDIHMNLPENDNSNRAPGEHRSDAGNRIENVCATRLKS